MGEYYREKELLAAAFQPILEWITKQVRIFTYVMCEFELMTSA